jgi:DNA-directed RNA polymerase subunit RPC12/RpoP
VVIEHEVIRCPYCVLGDEFRVMTALSDGRLVCGKCGHLAILSDRNFKGACPKCFESRAFDPRRYA